MQSLDCHENTRKFIFEYLLALDCPRALTCYLLWEHGEHNQLAELEFDPMSYNDVGNARDSLAATKLLSKATFLSTNIDLEAVAMGKFYDAELQCKKTNDNLLNLADKPDLAGWLLAAQFKLANILGDFTPDEFVDSCDFGPGSSTIIPRRRANHPYKYQFETGITRKARDFISGWFSAAYPLWEVDFTEQSGCKVTTVPKNAKTHRVIAIEPGINLWFQKGIGAMIRKRLRRHGIDLQLQSINADRSRIAAKFNHLATVDFSSASDTISKRLIYELLPPRWFQLLDTFRSNTAIVDGKPVVLEKFSSMGNGFTFELESLIFFVLAQVACDQCEVKHDISVFGDDVILPVSAFGTYRSIVEAVGFTVNEKKSYSSSYYRESCGSHYWNGICIKPVFLKKELYEEDELLKCANSVRRIAHRRNNYGCDRSLRRCWVFLVSLLGAKTPRVCEGYGDIGLVVNDDEAGVAGTRASNGIEGNFHTVFAYIPVQVSYLHRGLLLFKLKSLGCSSFTGRFDPLDITEAGSIGNSIPMPMQTKKVRKRLLIPRWTNLGPWI